MVFRIKQIDHVQLAAPKGCEGQAREFFEGILGFTEIEKPDNLKKRGGVWFSYGSTQVHIGVEDSFIPAKKAHPAFEVENVDGLKQHVMEKGVEVIEDDHLPGANRFYAYDPFGNRLEFLEWM